VVFTGRDTTGTSRDRCRCVTVLLLLLLHGFRTCLNTLWEANEALGLCIQTFAGGGIGTDGASSMFATRLCWLHPI
jgi:hypothetical protein